MTNITAEATAPDFISEVRRLRKQHQIHGRVTSALTAAIGRIFPDWTCVSEISQTPGGRNDAVVFESCGDSICFELFASKTQVDRDLLLLNQSPAKHKIAILIDRDVDETVASAYYRKRPDKPYPVIWLSEVLVPERTSILSVKLAQFVLGSKLSYAFQVSRQLTQTAHHRIFAQWRARGINIYTGRGSEKPTFVGVMSLLVVRRLRKLGLETANCEGAARAINDQFEFIIRQVLFGVPMYLVSHGTTHSVLDISDFEMWLRGSVLAKEGDHAAILLNTVYAELLTLYKGDLPKPGNMDRMLELIYGYENAASKKKRGKRNSRN